MLTELIVANIAVIEKQSVTFASGLNVLSGETGAGKSILLDALELILGGRASTGLIRTGSEALEVQAHFDLGALPEAVKRGLPDIAQAEELVISRAFNTQGKNKIYINGSLGTVALLGDIGKQLITICGQNQHVRLLEPSFHLSLIDGFVADEATLAKYQSQFELWREKSKKLEEVKLRIADREARVIWLEETKNELEPLGLKPGLRKELEGKIKRLQSSQKIISTINDLVAHGEEFSSQSHTVGSKIAELHKLDPEAASIQDLYSSMNATLDELVSQMGRYASSLETDEDAFEQLSEQVTTLARLERKHRVDDEGLCELLTQVKNELHEKPLETANQLEQEVAAIRKELISLAQQLSVQRKKAAKAICVQAGKELSELAMRAKLDITFDEIPLCSTGIDRVEILLAPNLGEQPKPLRSIASGGELSRVLLVLKKILRERSGINVLVFDEIDTGISGSVARAVGLKLKALAAQSQVICITHLAQVASLADKHIVVDKTSSGGRTRSIIKEITGEERVDEIARMLSGLKITDAARASAKELMKY